MNKIFKNNLVELIMILNIILLTLVEKAFLLAPVIIYFIILTNIMVLVLTLIFSKLFKKQISDVYPKVLFYSLILIFVVLLLSSVFATFFMPQAKNKELLIFLWVATLISTPNSFTFNSSKTKDFKLISTYLITLFLVLASTVITFRFSNLNMLRIVINILLLGVFTTMIYLIDKEEVQYYENNQNNFN